MQSGTSQNKLVSVTTLGKTMPSITVAQVKPVPITIWASPARHSRTMNVSPGSRQHADSGRDELRHLFAAWLPVVAWSVVSMSVGGVPSTVGRSHEVLQECADVCRIPQEGHN